MDTFNIVILATVLLEIAAIVLAFRAIGWSRTPQGAVAWVVFLLAAPFVAVIAYLFLGHSRVNGYVIARRDIPEALKGLQNLQRAHPPKTPEDNRFRAFETIAEASVVSGNDMQLLVDGFETFDSIFDAIDKAEHYVLIQFYIIRNDDIGRAFQNRLIEAARRGVTVRLLYDAVGCARLPQAYLDKMTEAGVEVHESNAMRGPSRRFQLNFRNHRKTVIVDGHTGFCGGLNVGNEYMGQSPQFRAWRDTHARIKGPVVQQMQLVYCEDWHWATAQNIGYDLLWQANEQAADMDALYMATGPADRTETGNLYFCACISAARHRIWIASPYCVPEIDIMAALKLAAMRGVQVRLLLPDQGDHRITWLAAYAYFDELREAGVEIWRYEAGFMHQKVLVVDDRIASVGSTNLDNRSCRLNFEGTAMVFDSDAANAVAQMLENDFAQSRLQQKTIQEQPVWVRLGAPLARLFAPLL